MSHNNNRQAEQTEIEVEEVREDISTLKALAVVIDEKLEWIPRSQLHRHTLKPPKIWVTPFIAKKLGY